MTRTHDLPRDRLEPPAESEHVANRRAALDPARPEVGDLHEAFGQWVLATRRRPLLEREGRIAFAGPVRVRREPTGTGHFRRIVEVYRDGWVPVTPRETWFAYCDDRDSVDEFLAERLTEALNPTGPDRREEE